MSTFFTGLCPNTGRLLFLLKVFSLHHAYVVVGPSGLMLGGKHQAPLETNIKFVVSVPSLCV